MTVYSVLGIAGAIILIYGLIYWLTRKTEKDAVQITTLKMQGEENEAASKKNKQSAETFSKPNLDSNELADSFNSLPE